MKTSGKALLALALVLMAAPALAENTGDWQDPAPVQDPYFDPPAVPDYDQPVEEPYYGDPEGMPGYEDPEDDPGYPGDPAGEPVPEGPIF